MVIDPGHGGLARGGGTNEAFEERNITLSVSKMMGVFLALRGHQIELTRTTREENPSLRERAQVANTANADFFVSIHVDRLPDTTRNPTESRISVLFQRNPDGTIREEQQAFAEATAGNIQIKGTRVVFWGGNLGVLRELDRGGPVGMLLETGNARSPTDTQRLGNFFSRLLHAARLSAAIDRAIREQRVEDE